MGRSRQHLKKIIKTAKSLGKINPGKKSKVQEKGLEEEISESTKIFFCTF